MGHWEWKRDILWYKGRIFVSPQLNSNKNILREYHDSMMEGHAKFLITYQRIKYFFGGEGMNKCIQKVVRECQVFQRNKGDIVKHPSLMQPLHILDQRWEDISMDFIIWLPKLEGKNDIFVVVDRLTKYAHFVDFKLHIRQAKWKKC